MHSKTKQIPMSSPMHWKLVLWPKTVYLESNVHNKDEAYAFAENRAHSCNATEGSLKDKIKHKEGVEAY